MTSFIPTPIPTRVTAPFFQRSEDLVLTSARQQRVRHRYRSAFISGAFLGAFSGAFLGAWDENDLAMGSGETSALQHTILGILERLAGGMMILR